MMGQGHGVELYYGTVFFDPASQETSNKLWKANQQSNSIPTKQPHSKIYQTQHWPSIDLRMAGNRQYQPFFKEVSYTFRNGLVNT